MKSTYIKTCLCTLLFMPALALAQKTEVSVHRGKVRAATTAAATNIAAGRKATILTNEEPVVTVSDPLVDDVMKLYKWVEEEQQAQRQRIDSFNITVLRIDDDWTTYAYLAEFKNDKSRASKTFTLGISAPDEIKFYDLQGNLLPFEFKRTDKNAGLYSITHTQSVEPGENFKFINVSRRRRSTVDIDAQGLRHQRFSWNVPYCLDFFRLILPSSAIFVESSRPVIAIENVAGRVAVTCRAYTGPMADGKFHFAYLLPDKDNTSLVDVPGRFRGLPAPQKEAIDKEYQTRLGAILSGQAHHDQSTPLLALLSLHSAVALDDEEQLIQLIGNPDFKEDVIKYTNEAMDQINQGLGGYGFLSTPPYPQAPQDGDKHPIHLCRKGSLLHEATVEMVFQDGTWYFWNYEVVWTSKQQNKQEEMAPAVVPDAETLAMLNAQGLVRTHSGAKRPRPFSISPWARN